jgi:hypothetical protein
MDIGKPQDSQGVLAVAQDLVQEDQVVQEMQEVILHQKETQVAQVTQVMKKLVAVVAELLALEVQDQMVLVELEKN